MHRPSPHSEKWPITVRMWASPTCWSSMYSFSGPMPSRFGPMLSLVNSTPMMWWPDVGTGAEMRSSGGMPRKLYA